MRTDGYFHVTTRANLISVFVDGVDPERSTGKRKVSWWVTFGGLGWALAHVSARTGIPVSELVIVHTGAPTDNSRRMVRTPYNENAFFCRIVIVPTRWFLPNDYFNHMGKEEDF